MNYDDKLASGIRDLDDARQFKELYPDAEHVIVQAKRDFGPDGWRLVDEWISRASFYDRYTLWLGGSGGIKMESHLAAAGDACRDAAESDIEGRV